MRIACPSCNAVYQVPDAQLREGRMVRCARCATDWAPNVALLEPDPAPPAPVSAPDPAPQPDPSPEPPARRMALEPDAPATAAAPPPEMLLAPSPARRKPPALALAWAASLLVVAAAIVALLLERAPIMRAWAPSIRAYAALGLAP